MRARMYEMMARFHDPYGDAPEKYGNVTTGDRYCASRYLPRDGSIARQTGVDERR